MPHTIILLTILWIEFKPCLDPIAPKIIDQPYEETYLRDRGSRLRNRELGNSNKHYKHELMIHLHVCHVLPSRTGEGDTYL